MQKEKNLILNGVKTHNLKNLSLSIPLKKLVFVKGPSGSGKSSLVFHTIFSESKRRFINSLPTDMKFFWDIPNKADVESISPVLPVWGLLQLNPIVGSRPIVGDLLGLSDMLQRLFLYNAREFCPHHQELLSSSFDVSLSQIFNKAKGNIHFFIDKESYQNFSDILPSRVLLKGKIQPFDESAELWELARYKNNSFEKAQLEIQQSLKKLLGFKKLVSIDSENFKNEELNTSQSKKCSKCDFVGVDHWGPEIFSALNAHGACTKCKGHGYTLNLSREKLVRDPRLSLKEGAFHLLKSAHFTSFQKIFLKEAQKRKIDLNKSFEEIESEALWELMLNGQGSFEGAEELFSYLEPYRYKPSTRIFIRSYQEEVLCTDCFGSRLHRRAQGLGIKTKSNKFISFSDILTMRLNDIILAIKEMELGIEFKLSKENIIEVLDWSKQMGLGHLEIHRKAKSLSTSEYQRILLVKYLSFKGSNSLIVLDEPSIGLSPKEQNVLINGLKALVAQGNSLIVVDHSEYMQKAADHIIEMGPGAGIHGGEILFQGPLKKSTAKKMTFKKDNISSRGEIVGRKIQLLNQQKYDISLKTEMIHLVLGDSGTGKSLLFLKNIANTIKFEIEGSLDFDNRPIKNLKIPKHLKKCYIFDTVISRYSSRSTVGSYLELAPYLRKYLANLPQSKLLSLKDGHFSSNSELGQCSRCEGSGTVSFDMQFMEDMLLTCDDCQGKKLKTFLAEISDGHHKVWQYYKLTIRQVFELIPTTPKAKRIVDFLEKFNLSHLSLERPLSSLSGGEVLRVKLISQLMKGTFESSILFFENISFGLSSVELKTIIEFLLELKRLGNTIVIIDNDPIFENIADQRHIFTRNQDLSVSIEHL